MAKRQTYRRGGKGYRSRRTNTRTPRQRFLIVCEGERTEPVYFECFRTPKLVVKVRGIGADPLEIVCRARQMRREDDYDQVWCVFDRDQWRPDPFNQAIASAHRQGINVAYSNEAFELWYLLHFHFCDTAMGRGLFADKLSDALGAPYRKNRPDMYAQLLPRQADAITHAQRLLDQQAGRPPANANPSTTVHLLVQELNKHARP